MSDLEKSLDQSQSGSYSQDKEVGIVDSYHYDNGLIGKLRRWGDKLHVEAKGIERITEEDKTNESVWNAGTMWFAANMVVSTFSLGALGIGIFGMQFWDSTLTIIFFNILGMIPVAFYSTFGPQFGLRQMILSRFWFGFHGVKVFAFLNCIACIGWAAVNTVVAAELLHSVNNGRLPPWGGVIIIAFLTLFVTFFGYKVVHTYEKYSWIPTFIIFLIIIARMSKSHSFTFGTMETGRIEAGNVLSFGTAIYGFSTGWASFASDYVVYQPKSTPKTKLFFVVFVGLGFPLIFCQILGAACMTGTLTNQMYADGYNTNGFGGLIYAVLVEDSLHGFGQFCLVILALSTVANNCPNFYSVSLSIQTVSTYFAMLPRFIWTLLATLVTIGIGIPAYYSFQSFMDNFMNIIGYWLAIYEGITLPEHFIFRGGFSGYVIEDYNTPSKLPVGMSALFAFACGVAGATVGMYQPWWTGPLAALVPGDIGIELSFGFAAIAYIAARPLELKIFGR
ncbi:permease for cytosine/purines, uracil, thiamine, allantoin-domain-containing protein [Lipomyces arxii]|uniref:permease for cytosine/purines, uracil, thiamine, allantoin-domain-containing protein n=1 Tax=Lipomyces arxii TaxID=56418 RepID=UPI0034CF409D